MEFAWEKEALFDRWCTANEAGNFEQLKQLVLMEEFKSCPAERVSAYLSENKTGDIFSVKYQWTNMSLLTRLCLSIGLSLRLPMVSMWMDGGF